MPPLRGAAFQGPARRGVVPLRVGGAGAEAGGEQDTAGLPAAAGENSQVRGNGSVVVSVMIKNGPKGAPRPQQRDPRLSLQRGLNGECIHFWNIDSENVGTCRYCGEVRQFRPWEGLSSIVIKEGNGRKGGDMGRQSKFTEEERKAIVKEALERGLTVVAKERGIPKTTLHCWISRQKRSEQRVEDKSTTIATRVRGIRMRNEVLERLDSVRSLSKSDLFKDDQASGYIAALQWVLGESD